MNFLLKQRFAAWRKMPRNTLAGELAMLTVGVGIDLQQRPLEIAPAAWVAFVDGLNQAIPASAPALSHG